MSADWPVVRLGDYCEKIGSGATPRGGSGVYLEAGEIFLIRSQNVYNDGFKEDGLVFITEDSAEKLKNVVVEENDILLNITGDSVARVCLAKKEYLPARVNQHVAIIRPNKGEFDSRYLRYLLASPAMQDLLLTIAGAGATRNALTKGMIESLEVMKPPLRAQAAIADNLESLDDKIELNRKTNQTLEQIAQAIFKSWFVDFDPVRAKIAAREAFIQQHPEVTEEAISAAAGTEGDTLAHDAAKACERAAMCVISGKSEKQLNELGADTLQQLKATAALFPDALVDSELGEIPEGWLVNTFGDLLLKTIGGDWGKDEPDEKHTEKVKILRGTDLPKVYVGEDASVPIRFVDAKKLATRKLKAGDIVIEVSGGSKNQPTGRSLFLTEEIIERLNADLEPASFCRLFRPVSLEIGLMLGLHLRKIYDEGKTWSYQNQSTGISNFQTKIFLERELVITPTEEIGGRFYSIIMPFLKKMSGAENQTLTTLRDKLLPWLLAGESCLADDIA